MGFKGPQGYCVLILGQTAMKEQAKKRDFNDIQIWSAWYQFLILGQQESA